MGVEPVLVSAGELVVVVASVFEGGDAAGLGSDGLGGLGDGDAVLLASAASRAQFGVGGGLVSSR